MDNQADTLTDEEKHQIDEAISSNLGSPNPGDNDMSPMGIDDICRYRSGVTDVLGKVLPIIPGAHAKTLALIFYAVNSYLNIRCRKIDENLPTM